MAAPPSPCSCPDRVHCVLAHEQDSDRYRAAAFGCNSWACGSCKLRLAYEWACHVADRAEEASSKQTIQLLSGKVTESELARLKVRLTNEHGANYAAFECEPGLYLLLVAAPPSAQRWQRLRDLTAPVTLAEAQALLAAWYEGAGGREFESKGTRRRPVMTSRGWSKARQEKSDWVRVARIGEVTEEQAAAVAREEGATVTREASRSFGVYVPPGQLPASAVWVVEWRADPETSRRIAGRLASMAADGREGRGRAYRPAAAPEPDFGWADNPFVGVA